MSISDCCISLKGIKNVLVVLGVVDMRQLLLNIFTYSILILYKCVYFTFDQCLVRLVVTSHAFYLSILHLVSKLPQYQSKYLSNSFRMFSLNLVRDRNSVSVKGICRKYWYGYQSRSRNFFRRNRNAFFSNFTFYLFFATSWGNTSFCYLAFQK